jgi:hypothetical protein
MAVEEINTPDGRKLRDSNTKKLLGSRGDGLDRIPTVNGVSSDQIPAETSGQAEPKTPTLLAYEKFIEKTNDWIDTAPRKWSPEEMASILRNDDEAAVNLTLTDIAQLRATHRSIFGAGGEAGKDQLWCVSCGVVGPCPVMKQINKREEILLENLRQEHRGYGPYECQDEKCVGTDDNRRPHTYCIKCGTTIPCPALREAGLMEDIDGAIREVCTECGGTGAIMLDDYEGESVKRPCKKCSASGLSYPSRTKQEPAPTHLYDKLLAFRPIIGVKTLDTIKERFAESLDTDGAVEAGYQLGRAMGIDEGIGHAIGVLPPVLIENSTPVSQAEFAKITGKAEAFDAMFEDAKSMRHLIDLYGCSLGNLTANEFAQLEKISSSLPQEVRDMKAIADGFYTFWFDHAVANADQSDPSGRSLFDTGAPKKEDH